MSAIMIGVGGVGGTIVADVRRQLERRINAEGNTLGARQRAAQYRYFLLDTKDEPFSRGFRPNERFVIPGGLDKFYVDEKITNWHASDGRGDDFFELWWPTFNGIPYRVGDFDEGAGQIRIKGKLAYRIHIAQGETTIVDAIAEAIRSVRDARGVSSNRDLHKIPVYIVASLGGGTGSGIVLTLAKHLRRTLPTYCVLQGVFLLASIAALAPGKADEASIWANTDAALREIDYFQRSQAFRLDQPSPYLEWPGAGNRIPNREAPFQYIYLFTAFNRKTHPHQALDSYTRLVSECLVAENFGPINELIRGPHSQFVARFNETPDLDERPTSYASVGLAGLRYPAERIVQHLSRRFGARVIARAFEQVALDSREDIETAAKSFLQQRGDLWDEDPSLRLGFRMPMSEDEDMPQPRKIDDARFLAAREDRMPLLIGERLREFDAWKTQELLPFLTKQRARREHLMLRGGEQSLRTFLITQLSDPTNGVARSVASLSALEKIIGGDEGQLSTVNKVIADNANDGAGLKQDVKTQRALIQPGEKGARASLSLKDKTAKERFAGIWRQYVEAEIDLAVAGQVIAYYETVLNEIKATQSYLKELIVAARNQGLALDRIADDDLGPNIRDSVSNVGILDNVRIVDHHFGALMDQAVDDAGGGLINDLITGERGLLHALRTKVDRRAGVRHELVLDDFREAIRKAVLDAGQKHFKMAVDDLTIWEALKAECFARRDIDEPDADFDTAMNALALQREEAEADGNHLVNSDSFLLEQYIQAKLERLKNRAAPCWQLDQSELSNYTDRPGLLYSINVLSFDRNSFDEFAAKENLNAGLIRAIAQTVGVEPQHLKGSESVMLYRREGVAPLFFLDKDEKRDLRDNAARISGRNKEIYTDVRLKTVVDPIIDRPERPEHRRKYALGLMLHSVPAPEGRDGTHWIGWTRRSNQTAAFESALDAMAALAADRELERELFAVLNAEIGKLSDRGRSDRLEKALERAQVVQVDLNEELEELAELDHSNGHGTALERERALKAAELKWWQQTANALNRRLETTQFRV